MPDRPGWGGTGLDRGGAERKLGERLERLERRGRVLAGVGGELGNVERESVHASWYLSRRELGSGEGRGSWGEGVVGCALGAKGPVVAHGRGGIRRGLGSVGRKDGRTGSRMGDSADGRAPGRRRSGAV